jgi:hypothetical protein
VLVYERDSYPDFFLLLNYFILSKEIIGNKKTTVKGLRLLVAIFELNGTVLQNYF